MSKTKVICQSFEELIKLRALSNKIFQSVSSSVISFPTVIEMEDGPGGEVTFEEFQEYVE